MTRGDLAVNVTNNRVCMVMERHSPNVNPFYADYLVRYRNDEYRVVRERHMRRPMFGEVRAYRVKGDEK